MAKKVNKRFQELLKKVDKEKKYSVEEALSNIKNLASAKFDETIEVALKLNVDPRHADQMVRGSVVLPVVSVPGLLPWSVPGLPWLSIPRLG